jgi:hypothetical protein
MIVKKRNKTKKYTIPGQIRNSEGANVAGATGSTDNAAAIVKKIIIIFKNRKNIRQFA